MTGHGGPVISFSWSIEILPLDYFTWGAMQNIIYETRVNLEWDPVVWIIPTAAIILEIPNIFHYFRKSICSLNGRNFEHLLWGLFIKIYHLVFLLNFVKQMSVIFLQVPYQIVGGISTYVLLCTYDYQWCFPSAHHNWTWSPRTSWTVMLFYLVCSSLF